MIPDLTPKQFDDYYKRILTSGINGLKGIENFQAYQLKNHVNQMLSNSRDTAINFLTSNPNQVKCQGNPY